jgi:hypothetical protein
MNSPTNEDLRDWVGEHSGFDAEIGTELLARRASHDDLVAALKECGELVARLRRARPALGIDASGRAHRELPRESGGPVMSERFTIVFEGDICKLPFNPLTTETVYGCPIASAIGDALAEPDDVIEDLVAALKLVQRGIRKGRIKDQSIIPKAQPDATSVDVVSLSSIIDAALAKAEGRS